jgi:uncharacterized protein (TIGR02453 family)
LSKRSHTIRNFELQNYRMAQLQPSSFKFLEQLKKNNNREWFNAHKDTFLQEQEQVISFVDNLLNLLREHDEIETADGKHAMQRIYRDTRFSSDKTPYKTHWSGNFTRATKFRRGGYYFQLAPGESFISGGFWGPNADDLKRVREDIAFDSTPIRKILKQKNFISSFGELRGEQLKSAPKGFDKEHEAVDLLRYKQFLLRRYFTDEEVMSRNFLKEADKTYQHMRPFFDYMSEVLTTDINGISI